MHLGVRFQNNIVRIFTCCFQFYRIFRGFKRYFVGEKKKGVCGVDQDPGEWSAYIFLLYLGDLN